MDKQEAARAALDAHGALRATRQEEPDSDISPQAWLAWRTNVSEPAYAAWHSAMEELEAALGRKINRHPFNFRPLCEQILAGEEVAATREP